MAFLHGFLETNPSAPTQDLDLARPHPAGRNLGDRFAYALVRFLDEPRLYKGDDSCATDIVRVHSA